MIGNQLQNGNVQYLNMTPTSRKQTNLNLVLRQPIPDSGTKIEVKLTFNPSKINRQTMEATREMQQLLYPFQDVRHKELSADFTLLFERINWIKVD